MRMGIKHTKQIDEYDCGLACVTSIYKSFKKII
ncbi:hypothetical protein DOS74_03460 [Staphylococcus felis]|nr:hypothetical protein DOS59_05670 [Staphylococcus felis]REI00560.1 hypothetical protein DOS65_09515 [Staphylococcus felis]REI11979.1 hypothetical protein DOS66_03040 [Staphylococcus felis]REI12860.1 hypothetical protein DOS73_08880 [Staphylococcus felis]REI17636.1 hypothetical protein DOS74_03460 [Staphylococcus felis]